MREGLNEIQQQQVFVCVCVCVQSVHEACDILLDKSKVCINRFFPVSNLENINTMICICRPKI